jgi:hypothetical protein
MCKFEEYVLGYLQICENLKNWSKKKNFLKILLRRKLSGKKLTENKNAQSKKNLPNVFCSMAQSIVLVPQ